MHSSLLEAAKNSIQQESSAIETSYPPQPRKIRLPNEHIMDYAENLFHNWQ
jgi:hypothetical protein